MSRNDDEFTMNDALEIQKRHLGQWKIKLLPEVYDALVKHVMKTNETAKKPNEVFRGDFMTAFILNYKGNMTSRFGVRLKTQLSTDEISEILNNGFGELIESINFEIES